MTGWDWGLLDRDPLWARLEGEGERPPHLGDPTSARPDPDPAALASLTAATVPEPPIASDASAGSVDPVPVPGHAEQLSESSEPVEQPIVAFARETLGFDPSPRQAAILSEIYADDVRVAVLRLGRRSGKGRIASIVATYEATVNADLHLEAVLAGEQIAIVVVATSQRQARVIHRYIRSYLRRPSLAQLVVRDTDDELELRNGILIQTLPCHAAAARGPAVAVAILDEAAWFTGRDGSPLDVAELWSALEPATAQFAAGRLLVLSTPRWSTGWFADLVRRAASGDFAQLRHWHASTSDMNPRISPAFLEARQAEDPVAFRREYLAEFDSGVGALFDEATIRAAVRERGSLEPLRAPTRYVVAIDPAYTGDRFALVVGHVRDERLVIDHVAGWQGARARPLNHRAVLDEVATIAKAYQRAQVLLDQYAAEPIAQGLAERGLTPLRRPWRNELKVDAVTTLRQLLYQGRLELPAAAELVSELIALEQHPLPSGRPRIAAPPGGHDDFAMALLALAHHLAGGSQIAADRFSMVA